MARGPLIPTILLCLAGTAIVLASAPKEKWVLLFDGKTLEGWTPKIVGQELGKDPYNTFRVEDGKIVVRYDKYDGDYKDRFGHLFYKTEFSNYRLRLEYRFVGEQVKAGPGWAWRNSGVMIHGQAASTIGKDQSFPVSIEVQFLGGDGSGNRPTGNLCTPGTNVVYKGKLHTQHCTNSTSPTLDGDQWVKAEIEVRNGHFKHFINGALVTEYDAAQLDPNDADAKKLIKGDDLMVKGGTISLQSESHPVEFRNIEIMELK
jgi:hypothetical protein